MALALQEKRIKSADRVLEIFEMFDQGRRSVTVMEVARALEVPQSSTSELLGNLVRRGYLTRQRGGRVFQPTARIALLGAWVHPDLFRHGRLLEMIDDLVSRSGLGVSLCSVVGISLRHIHSVGAVPEVLSSGSERNLLRSPFGHALLSHRFGDEVRLLVQRINSQAAADDYVGYSELAPRLSEVSRRGSATGPVMPGWSGVAVRLPQGAGEEQLAIGIVGEDSEIEQRGDELLRNLRQAISSHIGPRVVSEWRDASATNQGLSQTGS